MHVSCTSVHGTLSAPGASGTTHGRRRPPPSRRQVNPTWGGGLAVVSSAGAVWDAGGPPAAPLCKRNGKHRRGRQATMSLGCNRWHLPHAQVRTALPAASRLRVSVPRTPRASSLPAPPIACPGWSVAVVLAPPPDPSAISHTRSCSNELALLPHTNRSVATGNSTCEHTLTHVMQAGPGMSRPAAPPPKCEVTTVMLPTSKATPSPAHETAETPHEQAGTSSHQKATWQHAWWRVPSGHRDRQAGKLGRQGHPCRGCTWAAHRGSCGPPSRGLQGVGAGARVPVGGLAEC